MSECLTASDVMEEHRMANSIANIFATCAASHRADPQPREVVSSQNKHPINLIKPSDAPSARWLATL